MESEKQSVQGEFVEIKGESYYAIYNVDQMDPFLISVVSDSDHWLFVSSTGGLTAGRVSSETALFPYIPSDKVHESCPHTGPKTILRVSGSDGQQVLWEPFDFERYHQQNVQCNLYKNILGNKLCFEEINHDLGLTFRYEWQNSDEFGFVRACALENHSEEKKSIELLDGLQNLLPPGTQSALQSTSSNLIDAYKWNELTAQSGLAMYTLYSGITDRPQPFEVLQANVVFCLGLCEQKILLSSEQIKAFRRGTEPIQENKMRGRRGAFFVSSKFELEAQGTKDWSLVAGLERTQAQIVELNEALIAQREQLGSDINATVEKGCANLRLLMSAVDGFQVSENQSVCVRHYANVLFNTMRGGIFVDQYSVSKKDFVKTIRHFNSQLFESCKSFLDQLPETIEYSSLMKKVQELGDAQLYRLSLEYLPLTFGRRHGDPSRPWNKFAIHLRDEEGNPLLYYQGNWRDIFQNWEALTYSYPEAIESAVAKFVNASTVDGYNPYRIEKTGIDWEVEEEDDPWSYIGYWGDHQIIYLLKLLELSKQFHPDQLMTLLFKPVFSYANVPYRIKGIEDLLKDPKNTIEFDHNLDQQIEQRVKDLGADGKLILDSRGEVYLVNLLEKLLVPLLSKLSNLVPDGGIWMNTQRPEWNDANNALVGQGVSMVTLYYLRRYVHYMTELLDGIEESFSVSREVKEWLQDTAGEIKAYLADSNQKSDKARYALVQKLGTIAGNYRSTVYQQEGFAGFSELNLGEVSELLKDALSLIDQTISAGKTESGLYHAYNLLDAQEESIRIDNLYPMLEGQVASLSSGLMSGKEVIQTLESLFSSPLFREDQQTFILYPDREGVDFLIKNQLKEDQVLAIPAIRKLQELGDTRLILKDASGDFRFHHSLINKEAVEERLNQLAQLYGEEIERDKAQIYELFEGVFNHREFTGRSGGMFGFEGLGSIYWHMVSKLLLAVQECYFKALETETVEVTDQIKSYYYRVREGLGFNKTPDVYGAFPTDPYSHTPGHSGANQPGMTGSVKEEILTRFGEFGLRVNGGKVSFEPTLLEESEFLNQDTELEYVDLKGCLQKLSVPAGSLAFTWCQVPVVYQKSAQQSKSLTLEVRDGEPLNLQGCELSPDLSKKLFQRTGEITKITLWC